MSSELQDSSFGDCLIFNEQRYNFFLNYASGYF